MAIYSAERTVIDAFRLMHQGGSDVAHEALRRWLRRRGNSPAALRHLRRGSERLPCRPPRPLPPSESRTRRARSRTDASWEPRGPASTVVPARLRLIWKA